ncbi:hypothetical protein LPB72_07185 [Hydrogenophaga crassostreae]|nr:hypothetical protein LPB72_07185 [Hydrogenophaga crassostreae]
MLDHDVFVKRANHDGDTKPVIKAPLVLHPDLAEDLRRLSASNGKVTLEVSPYFNTNLSSFPKRANEGSAETAHGLAVNVADEQALDVLLKFLITKGNSNLEAIAQASMMTVDALIGAFSDLDDRFTEAQVNMLFAHAEAPGRCMSMERLAEEGGYDDFRAANMQYGRLCGVVAKHLGVRGLPQQTQMLAYLAQDRNELGHWQWVMRPQVFAAMQESGLTGDQDSELETDPGYLGATYEIDNDPACQEISKTTREALIAARIGQGAYRQRMLDLWGGSCALTGCSIATVLIASHAKSWVRSSNEERLDEHNGLLLAASIDRLFDQGLISFNSDGQILLKESLSLDQLSILGLSPKSCLRSIHDQIRPYLADHRAQHNF